MSAAPIASVVVHPDGALITRTGRFAPVDGRIVVHPLPLLLDPTSVRAEVRGAPAKGLRVELDLLGEDRGPKPTLLQEWVEARDRVHRLDALVATTTEARALLASLSPRFESDPTVPVPPPERWLGWLDAERVLAERIAAADTRLRALARERKDAAEAVELLGEALRQESTASWWRRWEPTRRVVVDVDGDEPVELALSYRVTGASWSPSYALDADGALRSGRFAMRAMVVQSTGEDWDGVVLSLSSAPCERTIDVPELAALRLGARQPAPPAWRELPAGLEDLFPPSDDGTRTIDLPPPRDQGVTGSAAPMSNRAPKPMAVDSRAPSGAVTEDPDQDDVLLAGAVYDGPMVQPAPMSKSASFAVPGAAPLAEMSRALGRRARAGGGGAASAPASNLRSEPEPIDVGGAWLDYGQLRLGAWDDPAGVRGRLRPVGEDEVLREAGLPPEAAARFDTRSAEVRQRSSAVRGRPLPPLHVLPAPIGGTDVRIDAAGSVDVPSDGRAHSVAVQTWPVELDVTYRAVPRHDPRAFRRVTATLAYAAPLLPGPVDVHVDGRLELTSPWSGSPGRGRLVLGLGAEDRIKVARNVRYRESSAGMFGGSRKLYTTIEVSVASSLPRPVRLELLERTPVALAGAESTVELLESVPTVREYTGEPDGPILKGGRSQVLELPPGGEARATLTYAVTIGGKDEIVGGDRRG